MRLNLNIKPVVLLMTVLCLLMALSCVSASEISDMNNVTAIDDAVSGDALASHIDQIDEEGVTVDGTYMDEGLSGNDIGTGEGTFNDLNEEFKKLEQDNFYNIDKDYVFNEEADKENPVININASYVTIYGNGHVIDANGSDLAKFIVTGNNVIMYDLIFKNFKAMANGETSHIQWNGNNGLMATFKFYNNTAPNGGALCWNGNHGHIDYCLFENNTALNRGGAIYVTGENIWIEGATFRTFKSPLSDEAIYFSSKNGQTLNIKGGEFHNKDISGNAIKALWDEGCSVLYDGVDLSYESFETLCNEIENLKSGDYYIIKRNYAVTNTKGDLARNRIINIGADNVTIDGNGHTIDGGGAREFFALFNITGNNVCIFNLNIFNFRAYDSDYINSNKNIYGNNCNHLISPIEWQGDNGIISNCLFYDNVGDYGGAIYWAGNNGKIENCIFDDNAAFFGGSIYLSGNNNSIKDSIFNNSYTSNHGEAIYLKNNNNPILTLNNCSFISGMTISNTVEAENGCEVIYEGIIPKNTLPPMSFKQLTELLEQLKDGDTFNFERDCLFENFDGNLTINASNITINGNGYKIYGADTLSCLFNIFGDNVKIIGLTFDFVSYCYSCPSFISLSGNNGELRNCTFIGNAAKIGGVVNWNVNNGIIDNCVFINNSACAIYMDGTNNLISNCIFNNTFSSSHKNEVIYYIYRNIDKCGFLTIDNCSFESDNGVEIWIDGKSEVTIDGKSVPITIDELFDEISNLKCGDVYNIYRNYHSPSKSLIINHDNITINANGHTFYVYEGTLNESIIFVEANDVNINGLTIIDKDNLRNGSLITWDGDNGILANCSLIGNVAEFGGAITWIGNNGIIDNNEFEDNSALYAGGAIFIGGANNKISNCYFVNSGSQLADEAIYIDSTRRNFTLESVFFEYCHNFVDGLACDVDLSYLTTRQCVLGVADEYINLYPLLYVANMRVDTIYYNKDICYSASYDDIKGEFVFSIVKKFPEFDISYTKNFIFKNMFNSTLTDLFNNLSDGNYENRFIIEKTEYVGDESSYLDVMEKKLFSLGSLSPIDDILTNDKQNSKKSKEGFVDYTLNVVFTKSLIIDCDKTWKLEDSKFTNININGCRSIIRGSFEERDEDKWVTLENGKVFSASNIRLEGFNTAVENRGGVCMFINVNFYKNKMAYLIERDWGAAILNTGYVSCINCTFTENSATNGGAIFNQGLLVIEKCHFYRNNANGEGPSVCVGDGGMVIYDGVNVTGNDQVSIVHFAESMSLTTSTIIATLTPIVATFTGILFGAVTCNAFAGMAVGLLVGGVLGASSAAWIISQHFDVNYDRLDTALTLTITSAVAGALGGMIGGRLSGVFFRTLAYEVGPAELPIKWQLAKNLLFRDGILFAAAVSGSIVGVSTAGSSGIAYYFTND